MNTKTLLETAEAATEVLRLAEDHAQGVADWTHINRTASKLAAALRTTSTDDALREEVRDKCRELGMGLDYIAHRSANEILKEQAAA